MRLRRWIARLVLVAVSAGVAVMLAEIAFRILKLYPTYPRHYVGEYQNRPSQNFAADPHTGWRMQPNHRFSRQIGEREVPYLSDKDGFRIDPDAPPPRDPRRLIALGDSFTFGENVLARETYPALVAEALGGWSWENLAQPGYAVDQIWQSLVHDALPRRPDLVIVGIFPDDLNRSMSAFRPLEGLNKPTFKLDGGALVPATRDDRPSWIWRYLDEHSRVFALGRVIAASAAFRYGAGDIWRLNAAIIDDMIRVAAAARVPILFVHVPFKTFDRFPALAKHLEEKGALFVDPALALESSPEPAYFSANLHWNVVGHRIVAEQIAAFLRARPDLVPASRGR